MKRGTVSPCPFFQSSAMRFMNLRMLSMVRRMSLSALGLASL